MAQHLFRRPAHFASALLLSLSLQAGPSCAFDPANVPDGLYYNGTNVNYQLWTPLLLARGGKLLDPFVVARDEGVKALEGQGRTSMMEARTLFLYLGCLTDIELTAVQPLLATVPTVSVARFGGKSCSIQHQVALDNLHLPKNEQGSNAFPSYFVKQSHPSPSPLWLYGVPGILSGHDEPVLPKTEQDLGGQPERANGVVNFASLVPLPIIGPDLVGIAAVKKQPLPKYPIGVIEAAHRSEELAITSSALYRQITVLVKDKLWPVYYPRLERAIGKHFGGIARSHFELGLIQGVDLDNRNSFDYLGIGRIHADTRQGPARWIDVIFCWRKGDNSFQILRSSEAALLDPANRYFSEKHPSFWPPTLVISAFGDLDKDKRMEVVSSLTRPRAFIQPRNGQSGTILSLRDSIVHAWEESPSGLEWKEAFRTVDHEERQLSFKFVDFELQRYGE